MDTAANSKAGLAVRLAIWLATGFGIGRIPLAPGTCGSALALGLHALLAMLAARLGFAGQAANSVPMPVKLYLLQGTAILIVAGLGVWAAGRAADYLQQRDPKTVVIDEISGQLIAWFGVALADWRALVTGFLLFRLFDIWKPLLIRRTEGLPGGWGIMADDWLAGIYAALLLLLVRYAGWV